MQGSTDGKIRLRDGRQLGYAEWGDAEGRPLLYFHGWPGSRVEGRLADEAASARGIRLIAIDRPGMGLADFQRRRTLADWPDDVLELAAVLELDRFAVLGISGGGPYAAACAWKLTDRLTRTGIVSCLAPLDVAGIPSDGWATGGCSSSVTRPAAWRPVLTWSSSLRRSDCHRLTSASMQVP